MKPQSPALKILTLLSVLLFLAFHQETRPLASGSSAAAVVTEKVSLTVPMVSVALLVSLFVADEVTCNSTVLPAATMPSEVIHEPPLIRYELPLSPVMLMGAGCVMPVTVTGLQTMAVLTGMPVSSIKLKKLGFVPEITATSPADRARLKIFTSSIRPG